MVSNSGKRIEWIDFGKGITILFVMLAHVIGGVFKTDGFGNYDSISKISMAIIFTFIMPVFFALSGFLYQSTDDFQVYIKNIVKKAVNLFGPYIFFSIIYVALQHFGNSVHDLYPWKDLIFIFEKPIGYLWFLYVLFFIFVFVGILDLLKINMWWQLIIYFLSFIVSQTVNMPYFLGGALTWTICFYSGYVLKNIFFDKWRHKRIIFFVIAILLITGCMYQYLVSVNWYQTNAMSLNNFLTKLLSIPIAFYLFTHIKQTAFFQYFRRCGKYSLIIYLVHAPTASVIRVIMLKVGVSNYFILILIVSLITWYISLFVCWLSNKYIWINVLFSPYKYIKGTK